MGKQKQNKVAGEAIDTELPDEYVNHEAFRQMQHEAWAAMEGKTEEDVL